MLGPAMRHCHIRAEAGEDVEPLGPNRDPRRE